MNSSNALKRKVDDLHKQAEKIEELGVKLLEEAPFIEREERGGLFPTLDYHAPLKKIQREAIQKYQQWYSTSLQLVDEYTPEWRNEFKLHYDRSNSSFSTGVMEYLKLGVYSSFSYREGGISDFVNELETQLAILMSIPSVLEVKEMSLREFITADIARTEIEQAEILLDNGFERAAGSIAGVALELHLKTLCDVNGISYPPKPTIETLLQALYKEKKLDVTGLKHIQYLGSIRNKCSHSEPVSAKEVQSLIDGVKKLI
jgi:hypothetical protein